MLRVGVGLDNCPEEERTVKRGSHQTTNTGGMFGEGLHRCLYTDIFTIS
jgi:hypothetical protein